MLDGSALPTQPGLGARTQAPRTRVGQHAVSLLTGTLPAASAGLKVSTRISTPLAPEIKWPPEQKVKDCLCSSPQVGFAATRCGPGAPHSSCSAGCACVLLGRRSGTFFRLSPPPAPPYRSGAPPNPVLPSFRVASSSCFSTSVGGRRAWPVSTGPEIGGAFPQRQKPPSVVSGKGTGMHPPWVL